MILGVAKGTLSTPSKLQASQMLLHLILQDYRVKRSAITGDYRIFHLNITGGLQGFCHFYRVITVSRAKRGVDITTLPHVG